MDIAKKMAELIAEAYIKTYGFEKWNALGVEGQHEAIMHIANDVNNRF